MNAIGGFLNIDVFKKNNFYDYSLINSARNCLTLILNKFDIKKVYVPYYTCPVVWDAAIAAGCECVPYEINEEFMPLGISSDFPIIYTNYFGVCGKQVDKVADTYKNVIIDNSQAFYAQPQGMAAVYSPRKFFGLPDGGMLWPKFSFLHDMSRDVSWDRCGHLLKRIDLGPEAAYGEYKNNNNKLRDCPPRRMSRLTETLLDNIDLEQCRSKRLENFFILHNELSQKNCLEIDLAGDDVPLVYPFKVENPKLRETLIARRVYVARYWPETNNNCMREKTARRLADSIIPLPIDQRYGSREMRRILEIILS